jgi:hypothetical protein
MIPCVHRRDAEARRESGRDSKHSIFRRISAASGVNTRIQGDPPKLLRTAAPKYHRGDAVAHLLSSSDRGKNRPGSSQPTSSDRKITNDP